MAIEVAGVVARLGFRVDDDGANRFERKMRDLRGDAKRDVVVPLKGDLQAHDLDLYDKKLREIREKVRRREDFKAQLGADYDPRAFSAYERDSKRAVKHADDNVRAQGRLRTAFGSVSSAGVGMFAAAGGGYAIYQGLKSIVTASGDAEASAKRVATAVDNAGISFSRHADHIDEVIQKQSQLARFDDEDLADSFGRIIGLTKDVNEALELNALGADLARARQIDLDAGVKIVTKAYLGQVAGLKRIGIDIKPVTTEQDKLKASTKDSTQAQKDAAKEADNLATRQKALAELQKTFGGQAREYGKTQKGAIDGLKVAWENMQEVLGEKLAPDITKVTNRLTKFITGMTEGTGKGGEFVERLKEIWERIVKVYEAVRDANRWLTDFYEKVGRGAKRTADDLLGLASTILGVFADIAAGGAKLKIPGMKGISDDLRRMQHDLDKTREGLRKTGDEANRVDMGKVRKENRQTAKAFADMAKDGGSSLRDIARTTKRRSEDIRDDLGGKTEEGQRALTKNFRQAMGAVHRQMENGKTTTRDGMEAIRGYLADELRVYGLDIAEGQKLTGKHPFADTLGAKPPKFKAGGGWIGGPGQVGTDVVPAMLAPGEAVLNRHQQAVIEGMLGGGFLDQLFARVQTPHFMARGGIVPVPGFPGESAASSVIGKILQIARQFGLVLTDAFGAGHKSPGHTQFGTAADFAGPDASMDAAVRSLVAAGYTVGYDGRFGSAAWPGHGPSSVAGGNAHLHVELGGVGGAIAGALAKIAGVAVRGGGQVGRVAQGALNVARAGAQSFYENTVNSSLAMPVGGGGTGGGNAGNRTLGRRMLGAFGFGAGQFSSLDPLWMGESGWNHLASNPSSGAYGIPQALPGSKMAGAGADWQTNPATQIKWGLGYIKDRYGSPAKAYQTWLGRSPHWYSGGGRVQRFAKGGRPNTDFHSGVSEESNPGPAQGFLLRASRRTLAHRIGDYENYMGAVERTRSRYSIAERLYNRIDEGSLVDEKTGAVNVEAVQEKASRIFDMIALAGQIVHYLEEAQKVARRVVKSYQAIVSRLRLSLKFAKKKDRSGIRSQIADAITGRDEYQGIVSDLGFDITNARYDWEDLGKERDAILATSAGTPDTDTDTGGSSDTGDAGPSEDQQAITAQAISRAEALAADLGAVRASFQAFTSSGDIGSAKGSSAFGSTLVDAVGGIGGLGAAGVPLGFAGGPTVIVNSYALVPGSTAENLRISDAVVTALAERPVRPNTQATVGG